MGIDDEIPEGLRIKPCCYIFGCFSAPLLSVLNAVHWTAAPQQDLPAQEPLARGFLSPQANLAPIKTGDNSPLYISRKNRPSCNINLKKVQKNSLDRAVFLIINKMECGQPSQINTPSHCPDSAESHHIPRYP